MSAFKRIGAIAIVAISFSIVLLPISTPAQARDSFNGALFGGLAAGALVGGAIAGRGYAPRPYYAPAPVYVEPQEYEPECYVTRRPVYNSWGDFTGYRRVRECE